MNWKARLKQARLAKEQYRVKSHFAKAVGVSPATVTDWEKEVERGGIHALSGPNLVKVCQLLDIQEAWLLCDKGLVPERKSFPQDNADGQRAYDDATQDLEDGPPFAQRPRKIPVIGYVQADDDGTMQIEEASPGHGHVPYWAICDDAYALRVRGDGMAPRYLSGEFIAVDPCALIEPNNEVIVVLNDGTRMIKRLLWQKPESIYLESISRDSVNVTVDMDDIKSLHRVIGCVPPEAFRLTS